jgi:biopolymer transport protein ExbB
MKCRFLTVAMALLPSFAAFAQSAPAAEAPKEIRVLDVIFSGGPVMYVLCVMSVIMAALAFALLLTVRPGAVVTDRFMESMEAMLRNRDLQGLSEFCSRQSQRMAAIVQRTVDFVLANPQAGIEELREVAQAEGSRQASQLTGRVTYLADIGGIAPLVGLLGTVIGMTQSFFDLGAGKEGVQQLELSSGIYKALFTTAGGLAVAVPSLMLYALFRGKALKLVNDLEAAATHFLVNLQMLETRNVTVARTVQSQPAEPVTPAPVVALSPRDLHGI